jgi:membrane protein YqaA with SNARE-associated domain
VFQGSIIAPMGSWIDALMAAMALPEVGLSTVFFIAFVASTLVPLGSEPASAPTSTSRTSIPMVVP